MPTQNLMKHKKRFIFVLGSNKYLKRRQSNAAGPVELYGCALLPGASI